MNNIAIAGLVGGGIGAVKGIIDQKEAQKYDPQAGTSVGSYISNSLRDGLEFAAIAAGGAGIAAVVKNPKAVAEAISGSKIKESKLYKAIIPGKDEFYKEVTNMINNDDKLKASLKSQDVEKTIATKIKEYANGAKIDISDETAQKIAHTGNGAVTDEAFENINKALQENGLAKEKTDKLTSKLQKYAQDVMDKPIDREKAINSNGKKMIVYPKTYYWNPDKTIRNTRIAATVGTASALAVGGRYLSGGTLTTDRYGQKDIAGIPFI